MLSGFRVTNNLGKYFGVPLIGRAPRRGDYQFLIDLVQEKLSSWKAKHLSFADRLTHAKSVIEALPLYSMMTATIPKGCLMRFRGATFFYLG